MSKTVSKKEKINTSKAAKTGSKKLSVKMKAVITSVVSVVCVAAITLGLVFGLRKPGKPGDENTKVDYKFSASQQLLANEINSNVKYSVFDIVDKVPYSKYTTIDKLTRYGDKYFAYKDSYGNEQFFVYWKDAQGNYQTRCLTDQQGLVDNNALSWSVEKMYGDYLVIANFYDNGKYENIFDEKIRFDLVSIKDPANPKIIFQFDTRGAGCYITSGDITLKDEYFAFNYLVGLNDPNATSLYYHSYFYAYSDEFIAHSSAHEDNFISDLPFNETTLTTFDYNKSGFLVTAGTKQTYYYLADNQFKSIERDIVIGNNSQVETEWKFIELSKDKLLIEKIDYLFDDSNLLPTTIKKESTEQLGVYTYSNKTYELFDIINGELTKVDFEFKSGYASVGKFEVDDTTTNSAFAIVYQKVDDNNVLIDDYLIVYYDANGNEIFNYISDDNTEQIVYASNNTFVTTKNILQPQNQVSATKLFDFSDKVYSIDTDLSINSNYIVLNSDDDSMAGIIDVWGKLIIDPETSGYTRIMDLVDNKCVAYDNEQEDGFIVDLLTGEKTELEDYDRNPLITGSGTGLNISKDATAQLSQIKNIYGNVVAENVTELRFPSAINGFEVIEVWTSENNAKATSYVVLSKVGENETVSHTSYSSGESTVVEPAVQSDASTYGISTATKSFTYGSLTVTDEKYITALAVSISYNPIATLTVSTGRRVSSAKFVVKMGSKTFSLTNFSTNAGGSYQTNRGDTIKVNYSNPDGASFVTAPNAYFSGWTLYCKWQYNYSYAYAGWGSNNISIDSSSSLTTQVLYAYCYFQGSGDDYYSEEFDSSLHNMVNTMDYTYDYYSANLTSETSISATTPTDDFVYYGHLSYYRYSRDSAGNMAGTWYGPTSYNSSNIANSSYSLSGTADLGVGFTLNFAGYYKTYFYAYFVQNTYNLNVDGSRKNTDLGVNKYSSAIYYGSKTGYNFTGWDYSGFGSGDHTATFYKSDGTSTNYTFSGASGTIPMKSGYSYIKIKYAGNYLEYGFSASLTSKYEPKIYTWYLRETTDKTLVNAGTREIYYKYDSGFYLDAACTTYRMTQTANPITYPIAVGYRVDTSANYAYYRISTSSNPVLTSNKGYIHYYSENGNLSYPNRDSVDAEANGTSNIAYADWSPIKYQIKYPSGCTLDGSNTEQTITATYGSVVSIPSPVGLYYDFNGFSISGASAGDTHNYGNSTSVTGSFTTATKSLSGSPSYLYFKNLWGTVDETKQSSAIHGTVTLTGNWLGKLYYVAYNMNGGNNISTQTCRYGSVYSSNGTPYKVGYNFAGWDVSGMDTVSHVFYAVQDGTITLTSSISTTTTTLGAEYKNFEFYSLRGTYVNNAAQTVTMSARWEPITYYITYSLTNGSYEGGTWGDTDSHPGSAVYEQSFAVDVPNIEKWPTGYDFTGWTISGLGSGAKYCTTQNGSYTAMVSGNTTTKTISTTTRLYFKDLAADEGDTISFQANWTAHKYNITYVANGGNVTLNSSSVTQLSYDQDGRVYVPTRKGYTFAGWALSELSDEVSHYYCPTSSWSSSQQVTFESTNGKYINPTNPNEFTLIGTGTYFRIKNLHYVSGATVVLTANWTANTYNITYHYTVDEDYSSYQTKDNLNKAGNQTRTKVQTVVFDQYFKTYMGAAVETTTTMRVPTGFKIAGWYFLMNGSAASSLNTEEYSGQYPENVCLPNTDYYFDYQFATDIMVSGTAVTYMNAYAIYEPIEITLKYYVPTDASNDLSKYVFNNQVTTTFGGSVTLAKYNTGSTYVSNWLVSTNLYVDGQTFDASRIIAYNSVSKYTYVGVTLNWGISNVYAHDPENPVFYLYGEVSQEYDARSLDKLSFSRVVDPTNGDYWYVYCSSADITGDVYIPNRYNNGTYDLPVREIATDAFYDAAKITSVYIPKNIELIGYYAFQFCSALESVTFENNSKLKSIQYEAFSGCTSLTSFTMPDSVTYIGNYCFYNCTSLQTLTLSASLKSLSRYFIQHTNSLTSLTIPNSVLSIDDGALNNTYLTSLNIPASVQTIGYQNVYYNTITSITVDANNKKFDSRNNCNAIIETATGNLIIGCKNSVIPNGVTEIENYAFFATTVANGGTLVIPEGVISIGESAFEDTTFKEVILPSTLKDLDYSSFRGSSLEEVILPRSLTVLNPYAFEGSKLKSVVIPENVATISGYAFYNCTDLISVYISGGVTTIASNAFSGAINIKYVFIPSTVTSVGASAFTTSAATIYLGKASSSAISSWNSSWNKGSSTVKYNTSSNYSVTQFLTNAYSDWTFRSSSEDYVIVTNYKGSKTAEKIPAMVNEVYFDDRDATITTALKNMTSLYVGTNVQMFTFSAPTGTKLTSLTLSSGLVTLGDNAFKNLSALTAINIPYTVSLIGRTVFSGCSALTSITVDSNNKTYEAVDNKNTIVEIANKSVIAGAGSSTIPSSAERIDGYSFENVTMTNLVIPGTIRVVDSYAFNMVTSNSITIEEGVEVLAERALQNINSSSGASVSLPASLYYIGHMAFRGGVTSITVASGNDVYDSRDNCNAVIETATNKLVQGCKTSVIPSTVTTIGSYAFASTTMPTSFVIPTSVTFIDNYAFDSTVFQGNISTSNVLKLGHHAFNYAIFNGTFTFGSKLVEIGNAALFYANFNGQELLEIPSNVKIIGENAFKYVSTISEIVFNDGLHAIGDYAFADFDGVENIAIPNSVKTIGTYAFSSMDALHYISFGNGITKLSDWVCYDNYALVSITIPDGVDEICSGAFYGCWSVTETIFIPDSVVYIGESAFYGVGGYYGVSVRFGRSINTIDNYAFESSGVMEVVLYDNVTYIGEYAFAYCTFLTYVNTGNGNVELYAGAFYHCVGLIDVAFSENLTYIGNSAFASCYSLKGLSLPSSSSYSIGYDAFMDCAALTQVELPGNITTIYPYAFAYTGIRYAWVSQYIGVIENHIFYYCGSMQTIFTDSPSAQNGWAYNWNYKSSGSEYTTYYYSSIATDYYSTVYPYFYFSGDYDDITLYEYSGYDTEVYIPNCVDYIGDSAFSYNSTIEKVVIPSTVKYIYSYAFNYCDSLSTVILPESLYYIGNNAFYYCSSLSNIDLPSGLTYLNAYAFYGTAITSLYIPASVYSIGDAIVNPSTLLFVEVDPANEYYDSRNGCNAIIDSIYNTLVLSSVNTTIPGSVETIGRYAFYNRNLGDFVLPDNITGIESYAFANAKINSITMQNVANIGNYAFQYSTVKTVNLSDNLTRIGNYAFDYASSLTSITIPDSVTEIGSYAFRSSGITSINIPKNVTAINSGVFASSKLQTIHIPANVTSIGSSAFSGCTSLTSVTMENGVSSIGSSAFSGCTNLVTMNMSMAVTTINSNAFYGCSKMKTFVMPSVVTTIGSTAFYNCDALTAIWLPSAASISASSYSNSPFYNCSTTLKIYTNASARMGSWGQYFNYYASGSTLTTNYSQSYSTYFAAMYPNYYVEPVSGENYLISYSGSETTVNIPHGVQLVYSDAFYAISTIQTINLPSSIRLVAYYAFTGLQNLTTITFAEGVQAVSTDMVRGDNNLTTINFPSTLKSFSATETVLNYSSLTNVTINSNNPYFAVKDGYVVEITSNKLVMPINRGLASYTIPSYIAEIGAYAFAGLTSFNTALTIPASVVDIEQYAFAYSENIASLTFASGSKLKSIGDYAFYKNKFATAALPEGVLTLGNRVFESSSNTSGITITIPSTVKSIGYGFASKNVAAINVASGNSYYTSASVGMLIELATNRLVSGKFSATTIPSSVKTIGPFAFYEMISGTSFTIPANIIAVDAYAFAGNTKLTSITFNEGLKEISYYSFYGCSKVASITLPNSLEHIDHHAFSNCSALKSVYIGDNVKQIAGSSSSESAFYGSSTSIVFYCADLERPKGWGTYWNYVSSSVKGVVVWGYDAATAASATSYSVSLDNSSNAGHYGNISYTVEQVVSSVSNNDMLLSSEENEIA